LQAVLAEEKARQRLQRSSIGGRNSVRTKYQMKSCSKSGTLRNSRLGSAERAHEEVARQPSDADQRPVMVAKKMPSSATRSVFDSR
jgi:hypothetical protein